jgi:hypothetical protein
MSDSLTIHESRFEEFAMRVMESLLDTGVIQLQPTIIGDSIRSSDDELIDHGVAVIKQLLHFQKYTHDNWEWDQEETHRRFRVDVPESLPRDGSAAI